MFGSHDVRKFGKRQARASRPLLAELEHRVVLSTFRVNTTLDTVAVNLKNGQDTTGHISLRSAIMAADAKPNADTIIVPAGTFALTIGGTGEDNDATGDLDIKGNLTINAKKRSKQAKATDTITANEASLGLAGVGGLSSTASTGGAGGGPNGLAGFGFAYQSGADGFTRFGVGGGLATFGTALIDNTTIAGNTATTSDKDVFGTFTT